MNNKVIKIILVVIAIVCLSAFIAGCSMSTDVTKKVGFAETQINNKWKASFRYFDGSDARRVHLDDGQSLIIEYSIEESEGQLELVIIDEDNNVLAAAEDAQGEISYKADDAIDVYITINAVEAKGSFEIIWDVVD